MSIEPSFTPGLGFRQALEAERPLQVVGTVNAYTALLARQAGFRAIYLSGAGVANASFGFPDLAMATLADVCEDVRRIAGACDLPLLVDADTGWGDAFMIGRTPMFTVDELREAGVAVALYPLTGFRAMSAAALKTFETLRSRGTQVDVLGNMQTRDELYDVLDYRSYERKLDALFANRD